MNVTIGGIARTVEITSFDKLGDVKVCMLTTTADGSVGFQQLNQEVVDTIYASFPVDTAEGDIASFEDGADNVPVRKLTMNLVPYQGGSGDPAPNNVRPIYPNNGKNLLPKGESRTTSAGLTITVNDDGTVLIKGTTFTTDFWGVQFTIPAGTYTYNGCPAGGSGSSYFMDIRNAVGGSGISGTGSDTGNGYTFTITSELTAYLNIRTASGYSYPTDGLLFKPMLRPAKITDSTYVPYNAIGITRTGANLCVPRSASAVGNIYNVGHLVPVKQNQTVYFYGEWTYTSSANMYARVFNNIDETSKSGSGAAPSGNYLVSGTAKALTMPQDGYVGICYNASVTSYTVDKMMISYEPIGQYEPYTAERYYPISDNPVYGGTLEVETGVLTLTHGVKIYDGTENWSTEYTYNFYSATGRGSGIQQTDYQCSHWKYNNILGNSTDTSKMPSAYISASGNFNVQRADISHTGADMKQWCLNQYQNGTPLTVVFRLNTPQTYQLTPVQVKTLLGYNNIWTDSGTVEVQYLANIGLYIQKIIGATEDDMTANQNISANKYFFVGETLYLSTAAISAGQTIIVGTNCIKTNLADALNALNS